MSLTVSATRALLALALAACASLVLAAPGLAAKPASPGKSGKAKKVRTLNLPATVKVSRGATTLRLNQTIADALQTNGVALSVRRPARAGQAGISFPITNGRVAVAGSNGTVTGLTGRLRHVGGVQFTKGDQRVRMRNFVAHLGQTSTISAQVKIGTQRTVRVPVFELTYDPSTLQIQNGRRRTASISDVEVKITQATSAALLQLFGVNVPAGTTVGTAAVTTRIIGR